MIPPLVLITWEDAAQLDAETWVHATNHTYVPVVFQQVGYLLSDEPAGVVITSCWSPDAIGPRDQIPRGMIIEMRPLAAKGAVFKRSTKVKP